MGKIQGISARYGLALALTGLAVWLRWALLPIPGLLTPYLSVYPTIVFISVMLGLGPGLLAGSCGVLVTEIWIYTHTGSYSLEIVVLGRVIMVMASAAYLGYISRRLRLAETRARADAEGARAVQRQASENEKRYRSLFENSTDAIFITSPDGAVAAANPAACAMFGMTEAELCRAGRQGVIDCEDSRLGPALEERTRTGRFQGELSYRRKDGTRLLAEVSSVILNGDPLQSFMILRDITGRKHAEEARARLAAIVESSEDGILSKSLDGTILTWNAGAERIFGYPAGEMIDQSILRLIPPELHEEEERILQLLRRGESVRHFETVRLGRDGRRIDVSVTISPIKAPDGRVSGVSKIIRDITERKRAEAALRESEARFRAAFENGAIATALTGMNSKLLEVNPAFCEMLGYSESELAGQSVSIITHPDDVAQSLSAIHCLLEGKTASYRMEKRYIHKDGRIVWCDMGAALVRDAQGQPLYFITHVQDITERKRAEEALRESEFRFRRLFDVNMIGLVFSDSYSDQVLWANDYYLNLLGVSREEFEQQGLYWPDFTPPEYREREMRSKEEARRRGGISKPFEKEYQRRDGSRVPVLVGVAPLDEDRRLVVGFILDLTEKKQVENALREADRRKDEFLAMLSHELRNPLAPIRNAVHILRAVGSREPAIQRQHDTIDRQVSHMARLLDDLLDVARITRGKIDLKREPLDLGDVLLQVVETIMPLIRARRHTLCFDPSLDQLVVEGDPDRLSQVIGNLLINAAKYTEENGQIWLIAQREHDHVMISVRDTGIGISPEMLPHVFELFAQADQSLDRSQGGLGIGLTMVKRLVEMHGGTVEAHSAGLGQGSEFIVKLPLLAEGRCELDSTLPSAQVVELAQVPPRRILVVDDIVDTAESLCELLQLWGHHVATAHSGTAALEAAFEFLPEVVLLDIGMPGMDGFEVVRRLRQIPELSGVLLVALTGYGQESDREQTRAAGFDEHLVKPVDLRALEALLAQRV